MESDREDREFLHQETKRLLEHETPEMRQRAVEILEEGAEVLRRGRGWSGEELAQHIKLPPDWTEGFIEVKTRHLGQRILEMREMADLTPGGLVARARVSLETLRLLEEGCDSFDPTLDDLERLARALDTNPAFLWYWAERLAVGET